MVDEEYILDEDEAQILDEDSKVLSDEDVTSFSADSGNGAASTAVVLNLDYVFAATSANGASSFSANFDRQPKLSATSTLGAASTGTINFDRQPPIAATTGGTASTAALMLVDYVFLGTQGGTASTSADLLRIYGGGVDFILRDEEGYPVMDEDGEAIMHLGVADFSATVTATASTSAAFMLPAINFEVLRDDVVWYRNKRGRMSLITFTEPMAVADTSASLTIRISFSASTSSLGGASATFGPFSKRLWATQGGTASTSADLTSIWVKYAGAQGGTASTTVGLTVLVRLSTTSAQGQASVQVTATLVSAVEVDLVAIAGGQASLAGVLNTTPPLTVTVEASGAISGVLVATRGLGGTVEATTDTSMTLRPKTVGGRGCQGLLMGVYKKAA